LVGQVARLSAFTYHLDSWTIILKKDFLPNRKRPKKSYKKKRRMSTARPNIWIRASRLSKRIFLKTCGRQRLKHIKKTRSNESS